jgi:hypothetical protein
VAVPNAVAATCLPEDGVAGAWLNIAFVYQLFRVVGSTLEQIEQDNSTALVCFALRVSVWTGACLVCQLLGLPHASISFGRDGEWA